MHQESNQLLTVREMVGPIRVEGSFLAVVDARPSQKRDGSWYIRARLRDGSGTIAAVAWDNFEECRAALIPGRVVKVRGRVAESFNGDGFELTIERVRLARDDEYDPKNFVPSSTRDHRDLVAELRALIADLRPACRAVVAATLEPEMERLARWPAAVEAHHAWVGGLLEHTLEVARLAQAIAQTVPGPDRDLVVAGALLHDVGKLDTYRVGSSFEATDDGRLFGHVLTGFHRVKVACEAAKTPDDVALHLLHIIASHHGSLEFGAAREPATLEAIVVHYADELSAQLMQAGEAIKSRRDHATRWTDRAKGLKRDVFVGSIQPEPG